MSERSAPAPLIGYGREMFLIRPSLADRDVRALHEGWRRWSTRRTRTAAVLAAVTFVGVGLTIGVSLFYLVGSGALAGVVAVVVAAVAGVLAHGEVLRGSVWQHGADVVPLTPADRLLGAKLVDAVAPEQQHTMLWYLASARNDLTAAEQRCASGAVKGDAEALELLSHDRDQARARLARVLGRMRELALTPA